MKKPIKEGANTPKKEQKPRAPVTPISEPALPMLLVAITFVICLVTLIINKFIYPIGKELLAPVILQIVALVIPAYLAIMLTAGEKGIFSQMRGIGFRSFSVEHVFFVIFTSLFAACASLLLTLAFGGAYDASNGVMLLGSFTAGENEYTVSIPYIILTYAVIPAFAEELLFRGVIFSRLEKISFPFAALVSTVFYALAGFTLGGLIPYLFTGALLVFVLYTTGSLWPCVIVHFVLNVYRLFLETNISAYFLASSNDLLLIITVLLALAISSLLFFSESAKIFRKKARAVADCKLPGTSRLDGIKDIPGKIRASLAFKPTLICLIICLSVFVITLGLNYWF